MSCSRPNPRSIQTESGAFTRTSVTPGNRSNASSGSVMTAANRAVWPGDMVIGDLWTVARGYEQVIGIPTAPLNLDVPSAAVIEAVVGGVLLVIAYPASARFAFRRGPNIRRVPRVSSPNDPSHRQYHDLMTQIFLSLLGVILILDGLRRA